jgi:hypothetical protein
MREAFANAGASDLTGIAVAARPALHGRQLQDAADAVATLQEFTGQDFGQDAARWGSRLRANRWVYTAGRDESRSEGDGKS